MPETLSILEAWKGSSFNNKIYDYTPNNLTESVASENRAQHKLSTDTLQSYWEELKRSKVILRFNRM